MTKKMLIDAAHPEETRVVVVDGTRVDEFDFESQTRKQLRGNIYLAKVTRVEPSLQAAFVEYGGNRHGFLAFNEIHPDYYQIPVADREALLREQAEEEDEPPPSNGHRSEGDEDGEGAVASDDEDDVMEEELARRRRRLLRRYKIQEVIKRRQIMLVQVVKEERGNKGAALTTYLSLAGRYGVLMPNTARGGGISRKITTLTDRKRLKGIVQSLDVPTGMGLIIRTAGAKRTKLEIKRDYEYLMRLWDNIRETTLHSIAPALIYEEEDLVKRAIRDLFDKDVDSIFVEGDEGFREAKEFIRMLMPSQAKKVSAYREPTPLFVKHKVEDSLSQIYSPVVPLKSGGYLVINQTEALVAIDVNSGRATRERNIEATALKTNLEAAEEASRQLRLRDLAGLIVIDFIDMDEAKNNRAVEKKLKDCLKDDRARIQMGKISAFGLMEISRQRRRSGVLEGTTHVCEHCGGTGRVRSTESSALAALRAIELEAARGGAGSVTLRVPRAVGLYILNEKRAYLERLNLSHGLFVTVVIDDAIGHADHAIDRTSHADFQPKLPEPSTKDAIVDEEDDSFEDEVEEEEDDELIAAESDEDEEGGHGGAHEAREGGGRRRGRRRRRGGRGRDEDHAPLGAQEGGEDEGEDEDAEEGRHGGGFDGSREGRRRRRRGRRGGKRMREEGGQDEAYSWTRMRAPDGDPYVWMEPGQPVIAQRPPSDAAPAQAERAAAPSPAAEVVTQAPPPAPPSDTTDIWVELPAKEEPTARKPSRSRRGRGKAKPEVDAEPAEPGLESAAEPAPAPERAPEPGPAPTLEVVAATPEPAKAEPSKPAPPREPDPNEISGAPSAPKRGWWRRG
ncbi:MAG TPA: Rne/Rng family ribonuclease [Caulobacteraceae bacterium]|nr:Rne/Rng family ribonuclease [Caulobacteraceae bacterium]